MWYSASRNAMSWKPLLSIGVFTHTTCCCLCEQSTENCGFQDIVLRDVLCCMLLTQPVCAGRYGTSHNQRFGHKRKVLRCHRAPRQGWGGGDKCVCARGWQSLLPVLLPTHVATLLRCFGFAGGDPAERHAPVDGDPGADAHVRRHREAVVGQGVGDHCGHVRLHQPHR